MNTTEMVRIGNVLQDLTAAVEDLSKRLGALEDIGEHLEKIEETLRYVAARPHSVTTEEGYEGVF